MPTPACDCAAEPVATFPTFGTFVCAACGTADGPTFPFPATPILEDLADLYLYRFDDSLDFHALSRAAAEVQQNSGQGSVDPKAFESAACDVLQALADRYFRHGWDDARLIAANGRRLQELRRQYPAPRSCSAKGERLPGQAPEIGEGCWEQIKDDHGGLFLLDVYADYCSVCRRLMPVFNAAADILEERGIATCYRLNGPQNPNAVRELGVDIYPTLKLICNGQELRQLKAPKQCTVTDILNFVLDYESSDLIRDPSPFFATRSESAFGHVESWRHRLTRQGIDLLDDMECDRRTVLLHEKFKTLHGTHSPCAAPEAGFRTPTPTDPPRVLLLGGGMGAGKSTVVRALAGTEFWHRHGDHIVVIEADAFKMQDPLFAALRTAGVSNASEIVHKASVATAEDLLLDALEFGRDIVFDGTLSWEPFVTQTVAMIRDCHRRRWGRGPGYRKEGPEQYWVAGESRPCAGIPYLIEVVGVTVDPEVAVQRGIVRAITSGRGVPIPSQLQSHRMFSANFPHYLELVDAAALLDNNDGASQARPIVLKGPSVLAEGPGGESHGRGVRVLDAEAYRRFQRKAHLNPEARGLRDLYGDPPLVAPDPLLADGGEP